MSKKRKILISVISCCVLLILLAMLGVFQKSDKTERAQDTPDTEGVGGKGVTFGDLRSEGYELQAGVLKFLSKMVDEKEVQTAKLDDPEITFSLEHSEADGAPLIVISAAKGDAEMDPKSRNLNLAKKVELSKDVKITIQDTTITAPRLICDIKKKLAYTDDHVEIAREGFVVEGEGLEVNGETETARIKRNVKVTIAEGGELFILGEDEADKRKPKDVGAVRGDQSKEKDEERVEITCDGGLIFERATNKATLSDNVRIKRGTMEMRTDVLQIAFDSKEKKPTQIVALGNVIARDVGDAAASDAHDRSSKRGVECARLEWQNDEQRAILEGSPSDDPANPKGRAKIKEKNVEIASSIMELYPKGPEIVARKDGYLVATLGAKTDKEQAEKGADDANPIRIEWKKSMEYRNDPDSKIFRALFSGDVKVESREIKLRTEKLEASFDSENHEIQRLEASRKAQQEGDEQAHRNRLVLIPPKGDSQTKKPETDKKGGFFGTSADDGSPAEISCAGRITFTNTEHKVVFDEDVKAKRGDSSMSSQRLELILDKGNRELQNMIASGKAEIIDEKLKMKAREICFYKTADQITGKGPGEILMTVDDHEKSDKKAPAARTADDGASDDKIENIDVTWKGDMILKRKEGIAKFYDSVEATSGEGNRRISCDELHVVLDENEEMKLVRAIDNVQISDPKEGIEGKGDQFVLNTRTQRITLIGAPAEMSKDEYHVNSKRIVQTDKQKFECEGEGDFTMVLSKESDSKTEHSGKPAPGSAIKVEWKDKMDFDGAKGQGSFYGDVVASHGLRELHAQALYVLLNQEAQAATPIKKIVAEEEVRMIDYASKPKPGEEREIEMEGEGEKLTWDYESDLAILSGTPHARLWRGGMWAVADEFHFSDQAKSVKTKGKSFMSISTRGD